MPEEKLEVKPTQDDEVKPAPPQDLTPEQAKETIAKLEEIRDNNLKALKEERGKRQVNDGKVSELQGQVEYLSGQLEALQKPSPQLQLPDDDDYPTMKIVKQIIEAHAKATDAKITQTFDKHKMDRFQESEIKAREKYANAPEGLDYDSVSRKFTEILTQNPAYKGVVLNAVNPAEEVYRICLTHPDLRQIVEMATGQKVIDRINDPKLTIPKGAGDKGGKKDYTTEEILSMSDAERQRLMRGE